MAPPQVRTKTLFYCIMLASNVFLFYMTYYYISEKKDILNLFNVLIICNILVILYCVAQALLGGSTAGFMGFDDWTLQGNYAKRTVITGPFNAVGITAEYLVLQCMILMYYFLFVGKFKKILIAILFCNMLLLIGTANRGGFLSFLLSLVIFPFYFKERLGIKKSILTVLTLSIILLLASYIMVSFSDYDIMYKRLSDTEFDGITPDTRSGAKGWPMVIEKIAKKPIIGYGPLTIGARDLRGLPPDVLGGYPHNLYLFILYTTGITGLAAYSFLGFNYWLLLRRLRDRLRNFDPFISGIPLLGMAIFFIFLIDQIKIEFLRSNLLDYQHYLSVLFGMFCGLSRIGYHHNPLATAVSQAEPFSVPSSGSQDTLL